jgi:hypothetical protein
MNTKKQTFAAAIMQKLLLSIFFIILYATTAFAQSSDDYNKVEFYGGFSHNRVQPNAKSSTSFGTTFEQCSSAATDILGKNFQTSFCHRRGFNGFDTSITYNFNRYVGIKGNVTGHYKSEPFTDIFFGETETLRTKDRIYNFLVGVQLKDNSKTKRFKPFAHALVGASRFASTGVNTAPTYPPDNFTLKSHVTSFAMKFGGGIDLRVNRRIDLRLAELNYNPILTRDFPVTGSPYGSITQHSKRANNITIGFGIAIH